MVLVNALPRKAVSTVANIARKLRNRTCWKSAAAASTQHVVNARARLGFKHLLIFGLSLTTALLHAVKYQFAFLPTLSLGFLTTEL